MEQNGAAEIMVKLTKGIMKAIMKALGTNVPSLNELNTILKECQAIVNDRPIGVKPNSQSAADYLSPNSLLLGRNSEKISSGPFESDDVFEDDPERTKNRFLMVQRIVTRFWKVWTSLYFPTLLVRKKWHHWNRNMEVGDICMLQDPNTFRNEWRMCKVCDTFPDNHGVIRNVEVSVAPKCDGSKVYKPQAVTKLKRHVSNLIVIVPVEEETSPNIDGDQDNQNHPVTEKEPTVIKDHK